MSNTIQQRPGAYPTASPDPSNSRQSVSPQQFVPLNRCEKHTGQPPAVPSAQTIPSWPEPLSEKAFHGLAGEIVRTIKPHTEADPVAVLLQLLVAFGNIVGRGPHFWAERNRHGMNLFVVLVGTTSKSRKGTSWGHVRELSTIADPTWCGNCIQTGLSSGEGLIYAVRDPRGVEDPGIHEKRLLIIDEEFSSTLKMLVRSGNTLSPVLRLAWDESPLQILTKQSPCKATDAHISLVAHVTRDELRRDLTCTEMGNGFANRFLWACVCRSNILPDGSCVPESLIEPLAARLKEAVEYAQTLGDCELRRDRCARDLWHSVYRELSEGKPGLLGSVISRAEPQVMRLAGIYALLDHAGEISEDHLLAALAVWNYCEASARFVFGDALGDPLADELLSRLKQAFDGLTRTEINDSFARNRKETEITRALYVLAERGLARCRRETGRPGRPVERWRVV